MFVYVSSDFLSRYQSLDYVGRIYLVFRYFADEITWVNKQFSHTRYLMQENSDLRSELLALQAKLNSYDFLVKENSGLKELLGSSSKLGGSFISARVIGWVNSKDHVAIINVGAKDMVFLGQGVLGAKGVLGQVVEVSSDTSKVSLITSPKTSIHVSNNGSFKGFAHGIDNAVQVDNVSVNENIRLGDKVFSSGVAGIYPAGYPYALVTEVIENNSGNKTAKMSPTADLGHLDMVLLYWAEKPVRPPYRSFL